MSQHTVPVEVAQRIVRCADRRGIVVLARTSRSLQTAAEKRLYHTIEVIHSPAAFAICHTLATCPRVAGYVRNLMLVMVTQRHRDRDRDHDHAYYLMQQTVASEDYWEVVRKALENLRTLDYLFLSDPTFRNSWILKPTDNWTLQAKEIRLYLPWDLNVTRLLNTQNDLRILCVAEVSEESIQLAELSGTALPHLTQFEGPLILIDQLLHCPITHLKLSVVSEEDIALLPFVLEKLHRFKKLRNLSVTPIPEEVMLPTLATIAAVCPNLKYLSHLPLPIEHKDRITFLQRLTHLADLSFLEVDVSHWVPQLIGSHQRIFAVEMRMVLPKIRYVVFYNKNDRWLWIWDEDHVEPVRHQQLEAGKEAGSVGEEGVPYVVGLEGWRHQLSHPHYPTHSNLWCSA